MKPILHAIFGKGDSKKKSERSASAAPSARRLRLEPLESRDLLAVSVAELGAICEKYSDLNISTNRNDYNIIEITAAELSDAKLRAAITEAGSTAANDLIVLRTTLESNEILLSGTALNIEIDQDIYGSLTLVSWGTNPLFIRGNNQSTVFQISHSTVFMGGFGITQGRGGILFTTSVACLTEMLFYQNMTNGGIQQENGELRISNSVFDSNVSYDGAGFQQNGGRATLSQVTFENNFTSNSGVGRGGAVFLSWGTTLMDQVTIKGNRATEGGGLYLNNNATTLYNSLVVENTATRNTGGIYQSFGSSVFTNITVARNSAPDKSGGIYVENTDNVQIWNSILAENLQGTSSKVDFSNSQCITRIDFSIVENIGNAQYYNVTSLLRDNPKFLDSQNGNYRIGSGSTAIDSGDADKCVYSHYRDIVGATRNLGGGVDMGAYEALPAAGILPFELIVSSLTDTIDGNLNNGQMSLREALEMSMRIPFLYTEITFADSLFSSGPQTIKLTSGYFDISHTIAIRGPGSDKLIIDAGNASQHFRVKQGNLTLENLSLVSGLGVDGGAIFSDGGNVSLIGVDFRSNNCVARGGALFQYTGTLSVQNSLFQDNSAILYGGAISAWSATQTEIEDSLFRGNRSRYGGAMNLQQNSAPNPSRVTASQFVDNFATQGGAVYQSSWGDIQYENSLFANNTATDGQTLYARTAKTRLNNCTVVASRTEDENCSEFHLSNIAVGEFVVHNSIISNGSHLAVKTGENATDDSYRFEHSLVENGFGVSLSNNTDGNLVGTKTEPLNPKFVDSENGDYRLSNESPAIDAGENAFVNTETDILKTPRIQGNAVDMGAYESIPQVSTQNNWIGPDGGEWMEPSNWSNHHVPMETETAFIEEGKTVRIVTQLNQYILFLSAKSVLCHGTLEIVASNNPDGFTVEFRGFVDIKGNLFMGMRTSINLVAGGDISGSITNEGENNIRVYYENAVISGVTEVSGLSFFVAADLSLPNLRLFTVDTYNDIRIEEGCNLNMPKLERVDSLTGRSLYLNILGGNLQIPIIQDVSNIDFHVQSSFLDISSITEQTATNFSIQTHGVFNVKGLDKITRMIGGGISVSTNGTQTKITPFPNLVQMEDTTIDVYKSNVSFPVLSAYVSNRVNYFDSIYCRNGTLSFPILENLSIKNDANITIYCNGTIYQGDPITRTTIDFPALKTSGPGPVIFEAMDGYASIDAPKYTPHDDDTVTEYNNGRIHLNLLQLENIVFPKTVSASEYAAIEMTIHNASNIQSRRDLTLRYYLSQNAEIGNDLLLLQKNIGDRIPARGDLLVSDSLLIDEKMMGEFWLVIELTGENDIKTILSTPIVVTPPPLDLSVEPTSLYEGLDDSVAFTIQRKGDLNQPLEITITSSDTNELVVPKTVVIPAGDDAVTFYGSSVQDYLKDGDKNVIVMITANGFDDVFATVTVLDVPPAELATESVFVTPNSQYPGLNVEVAWSVKNLGKLATRSPYTTRLYLSDDEKIGNDTELAMLETEELLSPDTIKGTCQFS